MPSYTNKFNLYKYNTTTDGSLTFNFNTALNNNWDNLESKVAISIYNSGVTYTTGDCVLGSVSGVYNLYISLINNNLGNALTDTTKWRLTDLNPIGFIGYFGKGSVPAGYFVCDGSAVSRTTYSTLFSVISTTFGAGDGYTTFNLPNLIDKFPQGNWTVGQYKNAGLPNISGSIGTFFTVRDGLYGNGAFAVTSASYCGIWGTDADFRWSQFDFYASRSNGIYGNSTTVQPPALTLLPCIKY